MSHTSAIGSRRWLRTGQSTVQPACISFMHAAQRISLRVNPSPGLTACRFQWLITSAVQPRPGGAPELQAWCTLVCVCTACLLPLRHTVIVLQTVTRPKLGRIARLLLAACARLTHMCTGLIAFCYLHLCWFLPSPARRAPLTMSTSRPCWRRAPLAEARGRGACRAWAAA